MAPRTVALPVVFLLGAVVLAAAASTQEMRVARPGDIFVANLQTSDVAWFDGATGEYMGPFVAPGSGGLQNATGVAFGPDGHLYVGSSANHRVLRYDGATGQFLDTFIDGGELRNPFAVVFGPDGDLYVGAGTGNRVLRYDGTTGAFRGVAAEGHGLIQPIGLTFGADGLLYVVNSGQRTVLRFDGTTGEFHGQFVADTVRFLADLTFGADGDLYVTAAASGVVARYDGHTGAFVGMRARLPGERSAPVGIALAPDGALLVGDFSRGRLYRIGPNQADPVLLADEGLARPENIAIKPPG